MNAGAKKLLLFCATLALIGGTAFALVQVKSNRRLGNPGLKAESIPGSPVMKISLPENVTGFASSNVPTSQVVLDYLPKDTSFAQRIYYAPDGMGVQANIILMGADRTSIHRPDYCLPGQGWQIVDRSEVKIPVARPHPYELPVQRWTIHNKITLPDGRQQEVSGFYVFWFTAEDKVTGDYTGIQKSIVYNLLRRGVLERWAYVSYFTLCPPGLEEATFARVKNLIAESIPEFQLPPKK